MILTLKRTSFTPDGIFGELSDDSGKISLSTLEHSFDGKPKLYDGVFTCVAGIHKLHDLVPFRTFEVKGVVGHSGILFHIGNYNKDSDGCILVGMGKSDAMITHSVIAFSKFSALLEKSQSFMLVVKSV